MLFDAEKKKRLERIVNFVESVYVPMFLRVHLKPHASDGPENAFNKTKHRRAKPLKSDF